MEAKQRKKNIKIDDAVANFGSKMFGTDVDAANVWIGTQQSVTSMHQDWYENLYAVVTGQKCFTLLPPWAKSLLKRKRDMYPRGRYVYRNTHCKEGRHPGNALTPSETHLHPIKDNSSATHHQHTNAHSYWDSYAVELIATNASHDANAHNDDGTSREDTHATPMFELDGIPWVGVDEGRAAALGPVDWPVHDTVEDHEFSSCEIPVPYARRCSHHWLESTSDTLALNPLLEYLQDCLMHVEVGPGEVLYLPAMWFHRVAQRPARVDEPPSRGGLGVAKTLTTGVPGTTHQESSETDAGLVTALNYWFDMDWTKPAVVAQRLADELMESVVSSSTNVPT